YTTSDFVTVMLALADPLPSNFQGTVTPTAFTFTDGVLTITNFDTHAAVFIFATDGAGHIVGWSVVASNSDLGLGLRGSYHQPTASASAMKAISIPTTKDSTPFRRGNGAA